MGACCKAGSGYTMKLLDSHSMPECSHSGISFVDKKILMSEKSKLSIEGLSFENIKVKIIGKKITGNGALKVTLKSKLGKIFFQKEIKFSKKSWSEISFECKGSFDNCILEIERGRSAIGRVEVARIIANDDKKNTIKKVVKKNKPLDGSGELELYLQSMKVGKKIAIVVPYGIYGGGEVYLKNIFSRAKNLFKVDILYLSKNKLEFEFLNPNIKHKRKTLSNLPATLISHRYDAIIFYNSKKVYDVISNLKMEGKISSKVIEIYHSNFLWSDAIAKYPERVGVDKIFKVSDGLAQNITGVDDDSKILMPVGIDADLFIRKENTDIRNKLGIRKKTVFGMMSRLSPEKNIKYALDLVKDLDDIVLVIVGSGPSEGKLKAFVEVNNIDNVLFLGYKQNSHEFYNIFDAFLLTSKMEGTPISILEAMSCCLPIYSTDVGEINSNFGKLDNFNILTGSLERDRDILLSQVGKSNYYQNLREYILENHNIESISNKFFDKIINNFQKFDERDFESTLLIGEYI
jgi:glycosyltransferase involved in cell wall biosynthesis